MGKRNQTLNMNNSFLNKVSAERKVLKIVNAWTPGRLQLTGLSSAAIALWSNKVGHEDTKDIIDPLKILAELCQCLSDRSHETFQPIDSSLASKIETNLISLKNIVDHKQIFTHLS